MARSGFGRRLAALALAPVLLAASPGGRSAETPTVRARSVSDSVRQLLQADPAKVLVVGANLERFAQDLPSPRDRRLVLAHARWMTGEAYSRTRNISGALRNLNSAIALAEDAGEVPVQGDALLSRGWISFERGRPVDALRDYQAAYQLFLGIQDKRRQAVALQHLGMLYVGAGDLARAQTYYKQAREAAPTDRRLLQTLHNNIATAFGNADRYAEAAAQLEVAVGYAVAAGLPAQEAFSLNNLARFQVLKGDVPQAQASLARALAITRREGQPITPQLLATKAMVAQAAGDVRRAKAIVDDLVASGAVTHTQADLNTHMIASAVYRRAGDYRRALFHFQEYTRLQNETRALASSTNAALTAARFDFANQELRFSQTRSADLRRNAIIGGIVGVLVILGLIGGLIVVRRGRESLRRALEEVRVRQEAEREATRLAEHDALTGLRNRRYLKHTLFPQTTAALADNEECLVFLIDLDRFKPVNDRHGHDVGDSVLMEAAQRIRQAADAHEGIAVRLGGDEFVVVVRGSPVGERAKRLASQIIHDVSESYCVGELVLTIGASVGIAAYGTAGSTVDEVLRSADLAMYQAKRSGRRSYRFYTPDMDMKHRLRLATEEDLRAAVTGGQITTCFQPIRSLSGGRIIGFEAYPQWEHPQRGVVPAEEFLGIAEEIGLIGQMTATCLADAARAAAAWPDSVSLYISLAPSLLHDPWVTSKLLAALTGEDVAAHRVVIEISESTLAYDLDLSRAVVIGLRAAGLRVAMSEYGLGPSGLSMLRELQIDELKLAGSILSTNDAPTGLKLAASAAGVAQAWNLPLIATAVDSSELAQSLRDNGFSYGQGALFGAAYPADQVLGLLHSSAPEKGGRAHLRVV